MRACVRVRACDAVRVGGRVCAREHAWRGSGSACLGACDRGQGRGGSGPCATTCGRQRPGDPSSRTTAPYPLPRSPSSRAPPTSLPTAPRLAAVAAVVNREDVWGGRNPPPPARAGQLVKPVGVVTRLPPADAPFNDPAPRRSRHLRRAPKAGRADAARQGRGGGGRQVGRFPTGPSSSSSWTRSTRRDDFAAFRSVPAAADVDCARLRV